MKKLLLSLGFILCVSPAFAQNSLTVLYDVWSSPSSGNINASQPFWMTFSHSGETFQFQTNSSGRFYDTIPHPGVSTTITYVTYDCQGNEFVGTHTIGATQNYTGDTAIISCPLQLNSCQTMIHQLGSSTGLTLNLLDSTSSNFPNFNWAGRFSHWDFGDGNTAFQVDDAFVSHTYAQPGTYNVCLRSFVKDSIHNVTFCEDSVCLQITVGNPTPSGFCNASYWLDTTSSGGSNVYIVNNSTPGYNDPNYSTSYTWDFGDGNTSHQAYPVHTYANPGEYGVCLTVSTTDSNSNVCTDTFCDTLGIDSLGNVIYKSASGFTLNVLDSAGLATIGLANEVAEQSVRIYPNPAREVVNISLESKGYYKLTLFDLKGSQVKSLQGSANKEAVQLDLKNVKRGVYILSVETAEGVTNRKVIKN